MWSGPGTRVINPPGPGKLQESLKERNLRSQVKWLQKSIAPSLTARANQPRRPEVCLPFPQGTGRVTERVLRIPVPP